MILWNIKNIWKNAKNREDKISAYGVVVLHVCLINKRSSFDYWYADLEGKMYKFNNARGAIVCDNCRTIIKEDCGPSQPFEEGEAIDICKKCSMDCGNAKNYKGCRPPKCNKGKGCDACRKILDERLDSLAELIRKS